MIFNRQNLSESYVSTAVAGILAHARLTVGQSRTLALSTSIVIINMGVVVLDRR